MNSDKVPEDMERRRIAEIERFLSNHDIATILRRQGLGEFELKPTKTGGSSQICDEKKRKRRGVSDWLGDSNIVRQPMGEDKTCNRWDDDSTIDLLESMMKFVRNNGNQPVGVHPRRWRTIASGMNNPRGLTSDHFARSCFVRFDNLRRYRNQPLGSNSAKRNRKAGAVSDTVHKKLEEYMDLVYGESANREHAVDAASSDGKELVLLAADAALSDGKELIVLVDDGAEQVVEDTSEMGIVEQGMLDDASAMGATERELLESTSAMGIVKLENASMSEKESKQLVENISTMEKESGSYARESSPVLDLTKSSESEETVSADDASTSRTSDFEWTIDNDSDEEVSNYIRRKRGVEPMSKRRKSKSNTKRKEASSSMKIFFERRITRQSLQVEETCGENSKTEARSDIRG